jgi:membrane fusion protein (multidrug efflux system)
VVDGEGDVVESREVELGVARDGRQQIAKGLRVGERVIIDGVQKARQGSAVTPRSSSADAGEPSPAER